MPRGGGLAIFAIVISSLLILSTIIITLSKIFHKKASLNANLDSSNKNDKLNNNTNNSINKTNKLKTLGILLFIFTATTGIVAGILNHNNSPSYAAEGEIDITASDTTITVVRDNGPAHAVASTTITLNEATPAGYNLYVYGPEGNELTAENTTATIRPVPSSNSAISNNTYGVTADAEEDQTAPVITDTVWNPVGSSEESPLLITTTTEATNIGDTITIYYGILVDETLPAGTYTGSIEYKAYTRTYAITYNANGGTIDNESTITEHIAKGTKLGELPTPTRTGYTFNGWYETEEPQQGETPITAETVPTNNTTYYAKWTRDTYTITYNLNGGNINGSTDNLTSNVPTGEALGTLPSTNPTKQNYTFNGWFTAAEGGTKITTETIPESATTYYAQWILPIQDTANVIEVINNSSTNTTIATDIRDGKEYLVGKLADGKIWLLDNLNLDLTDPNVQSVMDDTNTNASNTSLNALFNGSDGGENGNLARSAVTATWRNDVWKAPIISMSNGTESGYPVGTYYSFCAASAGSYCYISSPDNTHASEDICPAGWRMPFDGGEYDELYYAYSNENNQDITFRNALRLPLSGWFSGSVSFFGEQGYWWSSSRFNRYSAHILVMDTKRSRSFLSRTLGLPVRCVMGS